MTPHAALPDIASEMKHRALNGCQGSHDGACCDPELEIHPEDWCNYCLMGIAAAALCAMAWQPMETAPKDGTEILAHNKPGERFIAWWDAYGEHWTDRDHKKRCPYGWMPLPAAAAPRGDAE